MDPSSVSRDYLLAHGVAVQNEESGSEKNHPAVGAWRVNANGAPFVPHLFTFSADGNMFTTNPTNVQEDPSEPHGGTNDSVGMGAWEATDNKRIQGTFYQLNAFADDHSPADDLEVRFRITIIGDDLIGDWKIVAFDAIGTFDGTRLLIKTF